MKTESETNAWLDKKCAEFEKEYQQLLEAAGLADCPDLDSYLESLSDLLRYGKFLKSLKDRLQGMKQAKALREDPLKALRQKPLLLNAVNPPVETV
jgi:hypothetical protein